MSAVSVTVGRILHPAGDAAGITSAQWGWSHLLWLAGLLTGMLGVTALYPRQRAQLGRLGFAGAAAAWLGMGLLSGAIYFEAIIEPGLLNRVPELVDILLDAAAMRLYLTVFLTSVGLFALGFLLFGIAMLRARVLPRWAITSSSAAWWEAPQGFLPPIVATLSSLCSGRAWPASATGYGRASKHPPHPQQQRSGDNSRKPLM